jgi:hypothetical protein
VGGVVGEWVCELRRAVRLLYQPRCVFSCVFRRLPFLIGVLSRIAGALINSGLFTQSPAQPVKHVVTTEGQVDGADLCLAL